MNNEVMLVPNEASPDFIIDPYHYANDKFVMATIDMKKEISRRMRPLTQRQRYIAKEVSKGVKVNEIAKTLDTTAASVSNTVNSPKVSEIINLLQHYELMIDAPLEFQRKHMLWRIAVDNEKSSPKTAIGAIDTLNKMTKTYGTEGGGSGVGSINIVINNANLPRGALDQ